MFFLLYFLSIETLFVNRMRTFCTQNRLDMINFKNGRERIGRNNILVSIVCIRYDFIEVRF